MNRRLGGDASLNAPLREEGEGEWQDWLVDDTANQEDALADREEADARLGALRQALTVLNPRERRIFEARRLADDPITLEELSTEFGVSRERVRQIEVRAFEKVQAAVKAGVARAQLPHARGDARVAGCVTRAGRDEAVCFVAPQARRRRAGGELGARPLVHEGRRMIEFVAREGLLCGGRRRLARRPPPRRRTPADDAGAKTIADFHRRLRRQGGAARRRRSRRRVRSITVSFDLGGGDRSA